MVMVMECYYHMELKSEGICVAHPMDMTVQVRKAWQDYFVTKGLKQPFEQVWEPVVEAQSVTADRYEGCMIPFYRFKGREKHGIYVEDYNFHSEIQIGFDQCGSFVERIDWSRHQLNMDDRFEVRNFTFTKYTRQVNHIVAYLDRCTVYDRILRDDVTLSQFLHNFTLAQITEFVNFASENNCPNVTALLLEYRQTHYPDLDPLAQFTLD